MEAIMTAEPTTRADEQPAPPAEAVLLDEDDTAAANLKAKVREAWQDFAGSLAAALSALVDGTTLDLTLDPTALGTGDAVYAVRVDAANGQLTALAVGNAALPAGYRLDPAAPAAPAAVGRAPPRGLGPSRRRVRPRPP